MTGHSIPSRAASQEYVCEHCGKRFTSAWSHEEAEAEARENWGQLPQEEKAIVCDDCYGQFMAWAHDKGLVR